MTNELSVEAYDYHLPDELIARYPLEVRSASRLLHITNDGISDKQFTDLPSLLNKGDLIVFNDTKVMKARLFGAKETGGKVEVLVERIINQDDEQYQDYRQLSQQLTTDDYPYIALCHVRASKSPKVGQTLYLADKAIECQVIGREENLFILAFAKPILADLEQYGEC